MELRTFPGNHLISAVRQSDPHFSGIEGGPATDDLFIRALLIRNATSRPIHLERLVFEVLASDRPVLRVSYRDDALQQRLRRGAWQLQQVAPPLAEFTYGGEQAPDPGSIADTLHLAPEQSAGLMYERLQVESDSPPDALRITLQASCDTGSQLAEDRLEIRRALPTTRLRFPLAGPCYIYCAPDNPEVLSHRRIQSQEFALDVVQLGPDLRYHPPPRKNDAYRCYGLPVLAAASGEVVAVHTDFPDNPGSEPLAGEELAILAETHGFLPVLVGNHVLIRHDRDEHTLYLHLKPHSVTVSPGQTVRAGEPIGELGNSGQSGGPHLHFALMDGPDLVRARGLPCLFTGLRHLVFDREVTEPLQSHWLVESMA